MSEIKWKIKNRIDQDSSLRKNVANSYKFEETL